MKLLANATLVVLLALSAVTVHAQDKLSAAKPSLFASYPNSISCKETDLAEAFKAAKGQNVTLNFSGTPAFSGVVINNFSKSNDLQYVAIRLPGLNNAVLALSKRIDENNNTVYIGHIMAPKNPDAYELKRAKDGSYQFVKIDLEKLLPTCSQE